MPTDAWGCSSSHAFSVLLLDELQKVPASPFLQPGEISLNGTQSSSIPSWLCITCRLAEDVLCHNILVTNEDAKQCENWCEPLRYTTTDWSPVELHVINHSPLKSRQRAAPLTIHLTSVLLSHFFSVKALEETVLKVFLKSR